MTTDSPAVLLIDRSAEAASTISAVLEARNSIRIVASTTPANERLAEMVAELHPDVVVIDHLAVLTEAAGLGEAIRAQGAGIVLHCTIDPAMARGDAITNRVDSVVLKNIGELDELIAAVHRVANRNAHRSGPATTSQAGRPK